MSAEEAHLLAAALADGGALAHVAWVGAMVPARLDSVAPGPARYATLAAARAGEHPEYVMLLEGRPGLLGTVATGAGGGWVMVEPLRGGPAAAQAAALGEALRQGGLRGPAAVCEHLARLMGRSEAPDPAAPWEGREGFVGRTVARA
jgi:hypothetical protein